MTIDPKETERHIATLCNACDSLASGGARKQSQAGDIAAAVIHLRALQARVTELEWERNEAFDRGRKTGREDVGKYSNAIGLIEAALGYAGARPLAETVAAVERLAAGQKAHTDRSRECQRQLAVEAREANARVGVLMTFDGAWRAGTMPASEYAETIIAALFAKEVEGG